MTDSLGIRDASRPPGRDHRPGSQSPWTADEWLTEETLSLLNVRSRMLDLLGLSREFTDHDALRLRRIEEKLDLVLAHLGIAYSENSTLAPEVRELADRGDKIGAIKLHRQATGAGLAAAKQQIEEYLDRRR
jgi:hypothetical protein